jgi:hypothetical protein
MKTVNTLEEILKIANGQQITISDIICTNGFYHKTGKKIELSQTLKDKIIDSLVSSFGGWEKTKKRIRSVLFWGPVPYHWTLERFIICQYSGDAFIHYIAGQDMTYEMKQGRNFYKNF